MTLIEIILMAFALSIDCFTVSFAAGLQHKCFSVRPILTMAFFFSLFQVIMPWLGWVASVSFYDYIEQYDHWIAFALLGGIGGYMIYNGIKGEEAKAIDTSHIGTLLLLSVAVSIDALAVGISFTCMGMELFHDILVPLTSIGVVSFLMTVAGALIGIYAGKRICISLEPIGGTILICIGLKILIEHLTA